MDSGLILKTVISVSSYCPGPHSVCAVRSGVSPQMRRNPRKPFSSSGAVPGLLQMTTILNPVTSSNEYGMQNKEEKKKRKNEIEDHRPLVVVMVNGGGSGSSGGGGCDGDDDNIQSSE